jgi:hypothetical protein
MPAPLAAGLFAKIGGGKTLAAAGAGRAMPSILGRNAAAAGGGGGGGNPVESMNQAIGEATNWFQTADPGGFGGPDQSNSEWSGR